MKIHVVIACRGEYDDYEETALCAFTSEVAANKLVETKNAESKVAYHAWKDWHQKFNSEWKKVTAKTPENHAAIRQLLGPTPVYNRETYRIDAIDLVDDASND